MKYTQATFTLPASGNRTTQKQWDFATLSSAEFLAKYASQSMTPEEKEEQRRSFAHGNVALHNPDVTRAVIDRSAAAIAAEPAD